MFDNPAMRCAAAALLLAAGPGFPALASEPPPKSKGATRAHPDAAKINSGNPRVIHAGPGAPYIGGRFTPPGSGKPEKKD
jgi:hypothetical protein